MDKRKRSHPESVLDLCGLTPAVGPKIVGFCTNGQPIGDIDVNLTHRTCFLVVVTLTDTLLTSVVRGNVVADILGFSTHADVVLLSDTLAGYLFKPIDPLSVIPSIKFAGGEKSGIGGVVQASEITPILVLEVGVTKGLLAVETVLQEGLFVVNHLGHAAPVRETDAGVEVDDRLLAGSMFGGDDDNTISCTGTVDSSG